MNTMKVEAKRNGTITMNLNVETKELTINVDCATLRSQEITDFCLLIVRYLEKLLSEL